MTYGHTNGAKPIAEETTEETTTEETTTEAEEESASAREPGQMTAEEIAAQERAWEIPPAGGPPHSGAGGHVTTEVDAQLPPELQALPEYHKDRQAAEQEIIRADVDQRAAERRAKVEADRAALEAKRQARQ